MRHALLAALAAAPLVSGCDGPLLFAQLDVPQVRITLPSESFPATDAAAQYWCSPTQTQPDCIATEIGYDLGAQLPVVNEPNVTYSLRLTSLAIALRADASGTDLGGVKGVQIRLRDPQAAGGGVVVASYARSAADPSPTSIAVAGDSSVDLAPFVRSGQLPLRVEMTFDAPTPAFTADVTSTYELEAKVDWGAYL